MVPIAASLSLACSIDLSPLSVSYCLYQGSFLSNHCQHFFVSYYVLSNCFSVLPICYYITSKTSSHFVSSYFMILDPAPYSTTFHIVVLSSVSLEFCYFTSR